MHVFLIRLTIPDTKLQDCPWMLCKARDTGQALLTAKRRVEKHVGVFPEQCRLDVVATLKESTVKESASCHALYR